LIACAALVASAAVVELAAVVGLAAGVLMTAEYGLCVDLIVQIILRAPSCAEADGPHCPVLEQPELMELGRDSTGHLGGDSWASALVDVPIQEMRIPLALIELEQLLVVVDSPQEPPILRQRVYSYGSGVWDVLLVKLGF